MEADKSTKHWKFALGSAINNLETLIWNFNSANEAQGYAFSSVPEPTELLDITHGFIQEDNYLLLGDRERLNKMRDFLIEKIIPIYHAGKNTASDMWHISTSSQIEQFITYEFDTIRKAARDNIPGELSSSLGSWFIEGFCRQWRDEWTEKLKEMNEDTQ